MKHTANFLAQHTWMSFGNGTQAAAQQEEKTGEDKFRLIMFMISHKRK